LGAGYARRLFKTGFLGRGFNSPRLHQNGINNFIVAGVLCRRLARSIAAPVWPFPFGDRDVRQASVLRLIVCAEQQPILDDR